MQIETLLLIVTFLFFTIFIYYVVPVTKSPRLSDLPKTESEIYIFYDSIVMDQYQGTINNMQSTDTEGNIVYGEYATSTKPEIK